MPTTSEYKTILSGLNHIDALLDTGPHWNYLTQAPKDENVIYYTFSVTSGNEDGKTGQEAFTLAQQNFANRAIQELGQITGIRFLEVSDGNTAQIHLCNIDIPQPAYTGLCSWHYSYDLNGFTASAYIYLDNNEYFGVNRNLAPGYQGYETLLHELGHAMGLKHPFDDDIHLPAAVDYTAFTLMSYNPAGGPYEHFNQYDVAALNWLYGGDGLRGELGMNSTTGGRYFTGTNMADRLIGTAFNDALEGDGGNDVIDGGSGTDTVVFRGARADYHVTQMPDGALVVTGGGEEGSDTLVNIEILHFADGSYSRAQAAGDTVPPAAPSINLVRNAAGYALGNAPLITGAAEPNSTVKVFVNQALAGTATVDASGLWTLTAAPLKDGLNYAVYATATDAAGNTSAASATITFNVDATAPVMPTGTAVVAPQSNHPVFAGTGEAGTMIQLVRVTDAVEIGRTVVDKDGTWRYESPAMPNGDYNVAVVSVDKADNATSGAQRVTFNVASPLNANGDARANLFKPGAGENAYDGMGGLDVAQYAGARANYTVKKEVFGYSVTDKAGERDTLVNIERVQFGDKWLALDVNGVAGQVYRIYQAAFDRVPDAGGFAYWLDAMDKGYTLNQVANFFMGNKEFIDMYMADPSDANFINQLYAHVLHRAPDAAGQKWWIDNIHAASRAEVLAMFTESPENQAQVIGVIQNGIEYTPWG